MMDKTGIEITALSKAVGTLSGCFDEILKVEMDELGDKKMSPEELYEMGYKAAVFGLYMIAKEKNKENDK